jgi:predicted alpha/beta superfamily hydrolase
VLVWLPPTYDDAESAARRYPVLYMHDGQNLFDAATSYAGEWCVDESMAALAHEGLEAIVVGIYHAGVHRIREYTPFSQAGGYGQGYIDWLVHTLKPRIDAEFRTRPEKEATFLAGSSMGGLISAYAFFAYPLVFGGAGIFSPAFWIAHGAIEEYVRRAPFVAGRLYLDHGTRESIAIRPMLDLLEAKGYTRDVDLRYVRAPGARHTEAAWAARFPDAVRFLLRAT